MPDKAFVDTNLLVYAISIGGDDSGKASVAKQLIQEKPVCLSTQVLGEFYNAVMSRRHRSPLTHEEAVAWIQLWKKFEVFEITTAHVDLALAIAGRFKISYYDALIVSAARLGDCELIYSEDLSDGQDYGGITVKNPFA
jgi:predicted nucleic acid-binding protein